MKKDSELSPTEAAVYCAVHGYELWQDHHDPLQPWGVSREDWLYWYWVIGEQLTPTDLRVAMEAADKDGPGQITLEFKAQIRNGDLTRIPLPDECPST